MEKNDTHAGEEELIGALAGGATTREAAERAGVDVRTVRRRLADDDFQQAVNEARERMFDAARGRLAALAGKAVDALERLMESEKPAAVMGAAKAVLEMGPRLRRTVNVDQQICHLEDDEEEGDPMPGDEELIAALAAGATTREAAEQAGVEEQAAQDRLADDDFCRAVSRARGRLFEVAWGRLASLAGRAIGVLERLMESDQPSVARGAAKAVLKIGMQFREVEYDVRLTRLEELAEERDRNPGPDVIIDDNPWYDEE